MNNNTPVKEKKTRNPKWTTDELILALDLYFEFPQARGNKSHKEVISLSETLNLLPIHDKSINTFRNPSGVGMKLSNFQAWDPDHTGKGLKQGSKLEGVVWDKYAGNKEKLKLDANAIILNYRELVGKTWYDEEEEYEASEGKILTRMHKVRERDSKIVRIKKESVLSKTGLLQCEACGFDFNKSYGVLGYGFAECHHDKPVSELDPGEKTQIDDLRIVCSNCHRMMHRAKPWLKVEDVKELLKKATMN